MVLTIGKDHITDGYTDPPQWASFKNIFVFLSGNVCSFFSTIGWYERETSHSENKCVF